MMITKIAAGVAACLVSCSAFAVQKDITVTANVDTEVEMMHADGSALPSTVTLDYRPGQGLQKHVMPTKIYTNDVTSDMQIRLVSAPELIESTGPTAIRVPLTVTYMGKTLSATPETILAADAFPSGDASSGSEKIDLEIAPTNPGVLTKNGRYNGLVSLALVHSTAKP